MGRPGGHPSSRLSHIHRTDVTTLNWKEDEEETVPMFRRHY